MNEAFRKIAHRVSRIAGSPWTFLLAASVVILWAATGWLFNFSNTWQLFINTITTVVTFLMVFLIQNTQNRDAQATHLQLDELIKASRPARDTLIGVEEDPDKKIEKLEQEFTKLRERVDKHHPHE
ncbi:MAG TPA: low affinity iron permease family protein [Candidatus Paceibacterota bacterium]|nr:low affinity iron permease family protein [Candidatus Paceibacterota bacterium]